MALKPVTKGWMNRALLESFSERGQRGSVPAAVFSMRPCRKIKIRTNPDLASVARFW
jgi:hypothetical protein